jgi:thiol-disulfide isomerase/thioredoxin
MRTFKLFRSHCLLGATALLLAGIPSLAGCDAGNDGTGAEGDDDDDDDNDESSASGGDDDDDDGSDQDSESASGGDDDDDDDDEDSSTSADDDDDESNGSDDDDDGSETSSEVEESTEGEDDDETTLTDDDDDDSSSSGEEETSSSGEDSSDEVNCGDIMPSGSGNKGDVLHDFSAPDQEGNVHTLHQHCEEGVAIVISTEWCGPCNEEAPMLQKMYEKYKERGVVLIAMLVQDQNGATGDMALAQRWATKHGLTHPVVAPKESDVADYWSPLEGYPSFKTMKTGIVVEGVNPFPLSESDLEAIAPK